MSNDKQYNTNGQKRALQSPAKKARGLKLLLALLTKEFIQIRRNPFLPRLIMIFPITSMCVMPWVLNMEIKNIKVDVIDNDRSVMSQQLVHKIEASKYFIFNGQKTSYEEAMKDIKSPDADMLMEIPPHFERDRMAYGNPQILIAANAVNGTKGALGTTYLSSIISQHVTPEPSAINAKISTLYLYNKNLNYKLFMIPALMAMLIMTLCGFLPTLNIVGEKESGTIEAMNVTPVSKSVFILAKLIPYWIMGLVVISLCFILSWLLYDITSAGNLALIYLLVALLSFVFSGLGLVISNYSHNMQQATFMMWFVIMIMMLMSGLFTPVRSMPDWAFKTTYLNPMHYFIDAIRTVFVRGGDFNSIANQVLGLGIFAVVLDLWAVFSYKKNH